MNQLKLIAQQRGGQLISKASSGKLKWKCQEGHIFTETAFRVKNRGKWCTQCGASNGEREIRSILRKHNIDFIDQYTIQELPNRKYDFCCFINGIKFIIEYDGIQHFQFCRKFHRCKTNFQKAQLIDQIKTFVAWNTQHRLIRLDYTQLSHLEYHLIHAFNSNLEIYLSTPSFYSYLLQANVNLNLLKSEAPLIYSKFIN